MSHVNVEKQKQGGRPRDPAITNRVLDAALAVYADRGWDGYNFEVVAKYAGVGRPAIYRRWSTRAELLVAAFQSRTWGLTVKRTGKLRDELAAITWSYSEVMRGSRGAAGLRLMLDQASGRKLPDALASVHHEITQKRNEEINSAVGRAIARGEVPPQLSASQVTRLLLGPILLWGFVTENNELAHPSSKDEIYELVDVVMNGLLRTEPAEPC